MTETTLNADMVNLMMSMMGRMMQEQSAANRLESDLTQAIQTILQKTQPFQGEDITKFLRIYEYEMFNKGATEAHMVSQFNRVVTPDVRTEIIELQERFKIDWKGFRQALLDEFLLDDKTRVTKRIFLEWVERRKGLTICELLKEFEMKYKELSTRDRELLESEKVSLFIQAADKSFKKDLAILLEDRRSSTGLKTDWDEVIEACRVLRRRVLLVEDSNESYEIKGTIKNHLPHELQPKVAGQGSTTESMLNDLVKGMQELQIKFSRLESDQASGKVKEAQRGTFIQRCIWCDSMEHQKKDCQEHKEALSKNQIFYQDGKIYSAETHQPIELNFGKGGMKKLVEEAEAKKVQAVYYAATSNLKVDSHSESNFWHKVIESAEKGKIGLNELRQAGDEIRNSTD